MAIAKAGAAPPESHPPIPIAFELDEAGFVTLVIEDAQGKRVRNLIAETPFTAGRHVVYWDGLDESGILPDPVARHVYQVRGKLVEPGDYHVRGLFRKDLNLRYEFSVYSPGSPPWPTADRTGGWLADHTPQAAVLSLPNGSPHGKQPQMLLGSTIAEGGYSLAWVNLNADKLYSGKASGWRGAYALARDPGPNPRADIHAYCAFLYHGIQVFGLQGEGEDYTAGRYVEQGRGVSAVPTVPILDYNEPPYAEEGVKGSKDVADGLDLAVFDHIIAVSLPETNEVLFVDAGQSPQSGAKQPSKKSVGRILGKASVARPTGLMTDSRGRLCVLSDKKLKQFDVDWKAPSLKNEKILVADGLEDPRRLAADERDNLYVSDWGRSHQVKVFSPQGKFLRAIGKPGGPQAGLYDPNGMSNPHGIAISADGHLWVAEHSYVPKRMSIWTLDGNLVRAIYGPARYGGGGTLDRWDPTRLFYAHPACMEFRLDWNNGEGRLHSISLPEDATGFTVRKKGGKPLLPERPIHVDERVYLTNQSEGANDLIAGIWLLRGDKAALVAAAGDLAIGGDEDNDFANFFAAHTRQINNRLPEGVVMTVGSVPKSPDAKRRITFLAQTGEAGKSKSVPVLQFWSDLNGDQQPQVEEFTFFVRHGERAPTSVSVDGEFAMLTASGLRLPPSGFTPAGAPIYDAAKAVRLTKDFVPAQFAPRHALLGRDGYLVVTGGPMEGYKDGQRSWYYHSQWPGGFGSVQAPRPQYPGQLINTMRLLGPTVTCPNAAANAAIEIWAVVGDYGQVFLLTTDGLFVASLFKDTRTGGHYWPTPADRGTLLNDVTLLGECYDPTITQTLDGKVYLQAGKNRCTLMRLDGLNTVRRLDVGPLKLTAQLLVQAKEYQVDRSTPDSATPSGADPPLTVTIRSQPPANGKPNDPEMPDIALQPERAAPAVDSKPDDFKSLMRNVAVKPEFAAPTVDGKLSDWKGADWAKIDNRSRAALCVSGDNLFVAYHMDFDYRLDNSPDSLDSLFKGGPAFDLMIGADPDADSHRKSPVPGDIRLLVTRVNKKTQAAVFRAVVPGTDEPVKYESPVGSATIDQVKDVSDKVRLAGGPHSEKTGTMRKGVPVILTYTEYEFSVPLAIVGLSPKDGLAIRGDLGLLLGQSGVTADRVYWHNKSSGMTSDLPTEARLTPSLWGQWIFQQKR